MANEILSKLKPSGASSAEYAFRAGYLYYGITTGTAERFAVTIQDLAGTSISIPAYYNGLTIALKFHTTPYETATLNVNNLGAKPIQYGSTNVAWQYFTPGAVYILVYDKATDTFRGVHSYDTRYSNATQSAAGLLSAADKTKLDGIASGANAYTHPSITATANTSTVSPAHGGTFTAIDSVTVNSNGHVTAYNTKTITLPADQNTDTMVTQTAVGSDYTYWRPLVIGSSNSATEGFSPSSVTDSAFTTQSISCQPSSGSIRANIYKFANNAQMEYDTTNKCIKFVFN